MRIPLEAKLQFRFSEGVWADMIITNGQKKPVEILKLGNFTPFDGWKYSVDAYHIAVLQSFHILKITLVDEDKINLNQQHALSTPVDHPFLNVYLQPGQELNLHIPLHEYFKLDFRKTYTLSVQYGRDSILAMASETFTLNK